MTATSAPWWSPWRPGVPGAAAGEVRRFILTLPLATLAPMGIGLCIASIAKTIAVAQDISHATSLARRMFRWE